jgi:O-antigen/teichoic acid export membrane protein
MHAPILARAWGLFAVGFGRIASLLLSAVGVRLAGAVIGFVLQIVLARWLTPEEMGGWFLMVSLASFAGLLIAAGYPTLGLTVLARYHAQGREEMARRFLEKSAYDIAKYGLLLAIPAIAFLLFAPVDTVTRLAVVCGLVIAPATAMIRLNGAAANAVRRYLMTIVPDFMGKTLLLLLVVTGWILLTQSLSLAVVATTFVILSYMTAWVSGRVLGADGITNWGSDTSSARLGQAWSARAWPLVIVAASMIAMADYLTLVATMLLPKAEVAQVGMAIRLTALVGFFTQASQQFVLRDLSGALHQRDPQQARTLLLRTNIACITVIIAALLGFAVLGKWVLSIFGPDYVPAYNVLLLLMVAQGLRALGGLNVHLLALGGGQRKLGRACLASFVIILALASLLAPHFGIEAIGIAAIAGELVWVWSVASLTREHTGWRGDLLAMFSRSNTIGRKPLRPSADLQAAE